MSRMAQITAIALVVAIVAGGMVAPAVAAASENSPKDPDGDGEFEDVNGDGELTEDDVTELVFELDSLEVDVDFNDDGNRTMEDVRLLEAEIQHRETPDTNATDPDGDDLYEDVNGDGKATFDDAVELAFSTEKLSYLWFDFNNDHSLTFDDAVELAFQVS